MSGFFDWKKPRVTNPVWRQRFEDIHQLMDREMWTVDDLKAMSDPTSEIHKTAVRMGVPNGMARAFKDELKEFKPQWRQAKALLTLGQRQ